MSDPDEVVWTSASATRMAVVVDADSYFRALRTALLGARRRVMLIGWDFDARIELARGEQAPGEPAAIGDFLPWLVERTPGLHIHLLRWDTGALKSIFRGATALKMLKWLRHPRLHAKLDSFHPAAASHHQKIVVIDDCFAFCGGIDVTGDRWDTRAHRDDDPGRRKPNGKPYDPWHDATSALQGPIAARLGDLARQRWAWATGETLAPVEGVTDCWPAELTPDFTHVDVGIARTLPEMPGRPAVREVEALFVDLIRRARHHVYAESQYFASRRVAEAIAARLDEPDGPEFVLVNPVAAEGWLEPLAMDTARARLVTALRRRDRHGRLRLYHPVTAKRQPIYVHAKVMVVDGEMLRIGSANMNNRSQGLDSECDVVVDARGDAAVAATVRRLRDDLLAEHLGTDVDTVAAAIEREGCLIAAVEALRGPGRSLVPYDVPDLDGVERWLADNEVLDPEGPGEAFEAMSAGGLLRRLRWRRSR